MPNHELDNDNLPDMPESASQQEDGVEAQIHEHEAASDASSSDRKDVALHDQHHLPPNVYLIPIRERPFFPKQTLPVVLNKETWIETFKNIERSKQWLVGLVYTPDASDQAKPEEFSDIGTLIRIHNPRVHDDRIQFIAEGVKRFKIEHWLSEAAPYRAHVSYPEDVVNDEQESENKAYAMAILSVLREMVPLNPLFGEEIKLFLNRFSFNDSATLADFAAGLTTADGQALQAILATFDLSERLDQVHNLFRQELELAKLQYNIRERVEENLSDHQRKFFLRQQLKEIQEELGITKDDRAVDLEKFESRLDKLSLPDDVTDKVSEELEKLGFLDTQSPEYGVTRNWLDWVSSLPWGNYSKDKLDLTTARKVLDKHHDALDDVKDRIVEFLAVGALKGEVKGSIILLVGPPGVGKTSIGKSIAEALGRSFYRFSVGGMRDEAEIKGHRRTYIGAMPGKFVQALKSCQTANPVIMLDEIDKIGSSYQGDPASALLEVLDPEQNKDFLDHYLDVRFDLSKVLFVCTANTTDSIPDALLDRMEVIRLAGYITEEKMRIAKRHLWPALLKESGISPKTIEITPPAIHHIIEGYAREAGVRNLRKMMERIIRKTAVKLVTGEIETARIHVKDIEESLGHPKFSNEKPENVVGVTTGLAWTSMGGATLNIEASRIHTLNRGFKLSGQLGNVMQESANIAYSYVSSNLARYKGDPKFFDEAFVHLHVPDGATPKDGPSAGITMATALLSLARNEKLKEPVAMTGELSLTGHVLPVGGIREKIIAARRVGIKNIIIPFDNKHDFDEMPDYLKEGLTMHFAKHFEDVVKLTFMPRTKVSLSKRSTDGINQRRRLSRAKTTQRRTVTDTASA
ncbi:MAG: endopeptidase La [Thiotrichales bacterium 34-46-19]|nr:MAG: endopeptidase La [Thiotrichales bacterium 35-46-9]OZA96071.1 MAG: endopeptidase La [Thiotrichales bacterium 34-46-19]